MVVDALAVADAATMVRTVIVAPAEAVEKLEDD